MRVLHAPPSKYPAMAVLSGWYKSLAVVCALASIVGVGYGLTLIDRNGAVGFVIVIGTLVWGALTVVSLLAFAEGIRLMIDIELALRQIRDRITESANGPNS